MRRNWVSSFCEWASIAGAVMVVSARLLGGKTETWEVVLWGVNLIAWVFFARRYRLMASALARSMEVLTEPVMRARVMALEDEMDAK